MARAGQHDHLVAVHRYAPDGLIGISSINCSDDP